jgi:hypothetical protein
MKPRPVLRLVLGGDTVTGPGTVQRFESIRDAGARATAFPS